VFKFKFKLALRVPVVLNFRACCARFAFDAWDVSRVRFQPRCY
jgi:hypothetical protein